MSQLDPTATSVRDICVSALRECGAFGLGQQPLASDIEEAWARLQWMLQQWERKRWLVYHLVNLFKTSTGATFYTVGPGGDIDTGAGSVRPGKIESAFTRQIQGSNQQFIDYRLEILQSREDYDYITLKSLVAGPGEACFLDSGWPLARFYIWPIPQANIYEVHLTIKEQLPASLANLSTTFALPYEYYGAMLYNLSLRLRPRYRIGTFPGDPLPGMAKDALNVLRGPNTQVAKLRMPSTIRRRGLYNIFSDRPY